MYLFSEDEEQPSLSMGGMTSFYINQLPPLKDFLLLLFFKETFESRHKHQGGFKVLSGVSPVAEVL